jgi:Fic family protein
MEHADLPPALVGAWRDRVGWVGGANPLVAALVAAPHTAIPALMEDLFAFVARDNVDPVSQAAVAHAHFEVIHPFADGNGRIGRILVGRILSHRLGVPVPPPVSQQFARDVGGYLSGLTRYRQGDVEGWVSWFADTVETAATRSAQVLDAVADRLASWHQSLSDLRTDAAARRLVDHLPAYPVLNASKAAAVLGVSEQAARTALAQLADRGVLSEATAPLPRPGRPTRWFVATGILDLLGDGMPRAGRRLARKA